MVLNEYTVNVDDQIILRDLKKISNQIYKLLPMREENEEWQKPLETVIIHLRGMSRLIDGCQETFFPLLCKLEGLLTLTNDRDFQAYRRTIFECLGLLQELKNYVS